MMVRSEKAPDKGGAAEEALRTYFLQSGAYVVRGVPLKKGGEDITDIDLWVYTRASANVRHISIVDIKNKKRAKGFERAIWAKGLQAAIGADEAIIANNAKTSALAEFAAEVGVRVISAGTLTAIERRFGSNAERLSNESLLFKWGDIPTSGSTTLKSKYVEATSELAQGIKFASVNRWLDDAAELYGLVIDRGRASEEYLRAAYLLSSLVAIGADYVGRETLFDDVETRENFFRQGLIFGRTDPEATKRYVDFAEQLVTEFLDRSGSSAAQIRAKFHQSTAKLSINSLAEFFARPGAGRDLVDGAIQLEAAAFSVSLLAPVDLPREAKTIIGLIADFAEISRQNILGRSSPRRGNDAPLSQLDLGFAKK